MKNRKYIKPFLFMMGAVFLLYFYRCPFRYILGIPCPGCGMTRALYAMVRFRFADAWRYHPLVYLIYPAAVAALMEMSGIHRFTARTRKMACCGMAVLFVVVYIIRISMGADVLCVNPEEGMLLRLWNWIV